MKRKTLIFLLFLVASSFSQSMRIWCDKESYGPGEAIVIHANVNYPKDANLQLVVDVSGKAPASLTSFIPIKAGEEREVNFTIWVTDTMPEGNYSVVGRLLEEDSELLTNTTYFLVSGTLGTIDFRLNSCKDEGCSAGGAVFIKGETVYLLYNSSVDNVVVDANLTYPDKSVQRIELPMSITLTQNGSYLLEARASKPGYKTAYSWLKFSALDEEVEISPTVIPPGWYANETAPKQPGQGNFTEKPMRGGEGKGTLYLFLLLLVLVLVVLTLGVIFLLKRKRTNK